jgi:hypothetical protein
MSNTCASRFAFRRRVERNVERPLCAIGAYGCSWPKAVCRSATAYDPQQPVDILKSGHSTVIETLPRKGALKPGTKWKFDY